MDESKTIAFMIGLYCKKNHKQESHGQGLCDSCAALLQYAQQRTERCPRKAEKTFCASCPIHCYQPAMRQEMRKVMRFSGPRMLFYHPKLALMHLKDTLDHRRKK